MKRPDGQSQKSVDERSKPGKKRLQAGDVAEPDEESPHTGKRGGENPHGDEWSGQGADEEDGTTAGNDPGRMQKRRRTPLRE